MSSYFNITVIAEWCALICSFFLLFRNTGRWKLFVLFMLLTAFIDWFGWYMLVGLHHKSNAFLYNMMIIVSNSFLLWFFSTHEYLQRFRKALHLIIPAFVIFCLINLLFLEGWSEYNAISETVADLLLVLVSAYLLYQIAKRPGYENLLASPFLWLSIGVLIYCMGSALLYNFYELLYKLDKRSGEFAARYVNFSLAIILYSCLSISFICKWKISGSSRE